MSYTTSCHCGAVSAEIDGDLPEKAITCNCSICRRKGHVLHFVPASAMQASVAEGALGDYTFNNHAIHHKFCRTCGCSPFGTGTGPDGREMASVNLRCVPECDLSAIDITEYDGASR